MISDKNLARKSSILATKWYLDLASWFGKARENY